MRVSTWVVLGGLSIAAACKSPETKMEKEADKTSLGTNSYGADLKFIQEHAPGAIELKTVDGSARVLLSADYQGRVMTSTATGDSGTSFGWLNYKLIADPEKKKQFNPIGGEERFWLGPEGGQYSIYFKGKDSFTMANWQVPPVIDTESFTLEKSTATAATFSKKTQLTNYSGTVFDLEILRTIQLLGKDDLSKRLQLEIPAGISMVGYETINSITNSGKADWTKEKGLLSIWLLGMFTPSPETVVIIPFSPGPDARSFITDNYFGAMPPERLQVKDSVLFFTCDGKHRSKIGLSPIIAKSLAAGFDFEKNVLTLVIPDVRKDAAYVNSKWELQKEPYKGDVINSYNDGPLADGTQMGPFFEIESSSPALELKKGQTGEYRQTTCHLTGDYIALKALVSQLLGVNLDDIKK
ncbi:DUF6786 family protein [Flavihumibacter fluvii]|uniref:DUF6786 family protein n=1 Tax=Flavihumibacter fluvii TaxID=2838157 RepID=UPI001BDEDFC4|nr:DUF6786 family protein [Flavihumibacter fluvii]ULQ50845.1 hypothetical protein KJS93_12200 [Flavihumibacter fluvii]